MTAATTIGMAAKSTTTAADDPGSPPFQGRGGAGAFAARAVFAFDEN
jgi:hypothetical protein